MIHRFPRPVSVLSLIKNEVMDFIYDNHCDLVPEWNRDLPNGLIGNIFDPVGKSSNIFTEY